MKRGFSVVLGLLAAGAMVLVACGCGQKGPLVQATKPAASAPTSAASAPPAR